MSMIFRNAALAAAILASSATYAVAQSGPVDGKGQAGAAAHRTIQQDTVARGDYSAAEEQMVAPSESYRSAELRRGSERGYETRSVSEPRGYRSDAQMSEEPSAEVSGPQDRR
ncbi:hypothetical protein ACFOWB_05915 [Chenggangzhangella methanolivorans]|uniref:hypothetical protein n=1 Tax=Chenggangzhangella methanolivorans TaxID=1437009 RepID=UPI0036081B45